MLKESTVLNLIISRGAGSDFISPGESSGYNSAASSINGDQSPMQNGKQKRLPVVREEMIDVIDERYLIIEQLLFSPFGFTSIITSEIRREMCYLIVLFGLDLVAWWSVQRRLISGAGTTATNGLDTTTTDKIRFIKNGIDRRLLWRNKKSESGFRRNAAGFKRLKSCWPKKRRNSLETASS